MFALATMAALGVGSIYLAAGPGSSPMPPSPSVEASATPIIVQPVDWLTIDDASILGVSHLRDGAVAPGGRSVVVGQPGGGHGNRSDYPTLPRDRFWTSTDGRDWHFAKMPAPDSGVRPFDVVATSEGFVAIGQDSPYADRPLGLLWTSSDGDDWSAIEIDQATFTSVDSVGDTVAIGGTLQGIPTVWTSTAGGPWTAVTVTEDRGFSPDQLAISPGGIYLVRDPATGQMYRSEDDAPFTSVDTSSSGVRDLGESSAITGVVDGFALFTARYGQQPVTWHSPDGREWRRRAAAPGLPGRWLGGGAAALMSADADVWDPYLAYVGADGTWCAVSAPDGAKDRMLGADRTQDGVLLAWGSRGRYGPPVIWHATGVTCGP